VISMSKTVEKRLDHWKSKLIDLSKRNKMINFRPTKRTSIHIIDELPTEIFQKVIVHRIPLDFLDFQSWENPNGYKSAEEIPPAEYVRQDSTALAERYIDNFLQTNLDQKALNENLYRLFLKSRSSMEEQGYNTLFLALGILEYYESENSQEKMRAPILFLPVELKRKSVSSSFQLFPLDDDFILNPAIVLKLEYDFGIKIEDLPDDLHRVSADDVLDNFKKAISGKKGWRVLNDIYLGIFSFNKFIMYKDLDSQHELILKHPIVAALAEGTCFSTDPSMIPDPATLDDKLSPLDTYQILDADSSQQAAILAAKSDQSFIVQGPPGTGKSQTIANIISECITAGKTVLFVSEKMAALEVVKRRLEKAGLGDFCLELHSKKANKREVIRELDRCLKSQKVNEPRRITDLYRLEQYRKDLNEYVRLLHTPFGKLQITPFIAHGQVAKYEWAPEIYFQIYNPLEFSHEDLEDKGRHLRELSVTLKKVAPLNQYLWYGCQITNLDYKKKTDIQKYLSNVKNSISELENKIHFLAKLCAASAPKSLDETENLIKIAKLLLKSPQPEPFMLRGEGWICFEIYNLDLEGILSRKEEYISFSNEDLIPEVENKARLLAKLCAISVPKSLEEVENLIKIAKLLLKSPQPEPFMLRGDSWISFSEEVRQAVNIGTEFFEGKKRLSKYYTDEIYNLDLEGILSRKEKYGSSFQKYSSPACGTNSGKIIQL